MRNLLVYFLALTLSGCAIKKDWPQNKIVTESSGVSRAGEYTAFTSPNIRNGINDGILSGWIYFDSYLIGIKGHSKKSNITNYLNIRASYRDNWLFFDGAVIGNKYIKAINIDRDVITCSPNEFFNNCNLVESFSIPLNTGDIDKVISGQDIYLSAKRHTNMQIKIPPEYFKNHMEFIKLR